MDHTRIEALKSECQDPLKNIAFLAVEVLHLAKSLNDFPACEWLEKEINGYTQGVELPKYRKLRLIWGRLANKRFIEGKMPTGEVAMGETPVVFSLTKLSGFLPDGVYFEGPLFEELGFHTWVKLPTSNILMIFDEVRNRIYGWLCSLNPISQPTDEHHQTTGISNRHELLKEAGRAGGKKKGEKLREVNFQQLADELWKLHPKWTKQRVCEDLATKHECSFSKVNSMVRRDKTPR